MKRILMMAVCAAAVIAGAKTLGTWVFTGEAETRAEDNAEFTNLEAGAPSDLVCYTSRHTPNASQVLGAKFESDVPGAWLFNDKMYTNKLAEITTSIHVATGGNSSATSTGGGASFVRITNLGKYLRDQNGVTQDFTIEMIVKPQWSYWYECKNTGKAYDYKQGGAMFAGLQGSDADHSPVLGFGEYNQPGGSIRAPLKDFQSFGNSGQNAIEYQWVTQSLYDNKWHRWVFKYTASNKMGTIYIDEKNGGSVKWVDGTLYPNGMALSDTSAFQVCGVLDKVTASFYGVNIAVIRVSTGALQDYELLQVTPNYTANPVALHLRFTGEHGEEFTECTNLCAGTLLYDSTMVASKDSYSKTVVYDAPPKVNITDGRASRNAIPNESIVRSLEKEQDGSVGIMGISVGSTAALTIRDMSFTAEGFYMLSSNACSAVGTDGNARQGFMNQMGGYYLSADKTAMSNIGWGLRTAVGGGDKIELFACKMTNLVTFAAKNWSDTSTSTTFSTGVWHHVAVVYDAEANPKTMKLFVDYEQKGTALTFEEGTAPRCTGPAVVDKNGKLRYCGNTLCLAGAHCNNANTGWFGGFDEFRFTYRALTPEEFLVMRAPFGTSINLR